MSLRAFLRDFDEMAFGALVAAGLGDRALYYLPADAALETNPIGPIHVLITQGTQFVEGGASRMPTGLVSIELQLADIPAPAPRGAKIVTLDSTDTPIARYEVQELDDRDQSKVSVFCRELSP